ncbi:MAG: hypothetical protein EOO54_08230 [Haliea sp.]|nr:MAG: hypothetical protein EOO54_08230 [Haliea sp.]
MKQRPAILKPCEIPGIASVEDGVVLLDGPDGVAVAMTPDAAAGTADSLRQAAARARTFANPIAPAVPEDDTP